MEWRPLEQNEKKKGWLLVAAFVAMVAYLILFSTGGGGWYKCPFHWLTGYSCPGCGMTRSTAAFLQGDFGRSLHFHPFGFAFVVGFGLFAAKALFFNIRGETPIVSERMKTWANRGWAVALVAIAGFGALRLILEVAGILTPI